MQSKTITTDKNNREDFKKKLLTKVEAALTPPAPSTPEPEPEEVEIVDRYSKWVPVRFAIDHDEILPSINQDEDYIPQGEIETRVSVKSALLNKVEESLTPSPSVESAPIEIVPKYSEWAPARVFLDPKEDYLLPEIKNQSPALSPQEAEKRVTIKASLLNKVEESLIPTVIEPDAATVEIIAKYSQGIPKHSTNEVEGFFPEFKKEDGQVLSMGEIEKRATIKDRLLDKVEVSLTPPTPPVVIPEPEILDQYVTWSSARLALNPQDELLPEFVVGETVITPREAEKRVTIKANLLNKVEESLIPATAKPEPAPIEIIEKYSQGIPTRSSDELEGFYPELTIDETVITPREVEKRASIKANLLNKVEESLIPAMVEPEPVPIEIIDKYSQGIPTRSPDELEGFFPEFKTDEPISSPYELEKRVIAKNRLLNRVEEALIPATVDEPEEIEILDNYSNWGPSRLDIEPQDELPLEFKREDPFIPHREIEKRASLKDNLFNKVEESLIPKPPVAEPEPEVIEILDQYSNWGPSRLALEPQDELPLEFKREDPFIPHREIEKRASLKASLLDKVEESLTPTLPVVEPEPVVIEVLDKFAGGIPIQLQDDAEPVFPEARRILKPAVIPTDVPKREAFKDSLVKKIGSITPKLNQVEPIEIIDYSQRSVSAVGQDFGEIKQIPLSSETLIPELQESIVDFVPIVEEAPIPVLCLPENYQDLNEQALYGVLIRDPGLKHTSETANLVLDVLAGRSTAKVEFTVVIKPKRIKPKKFNTPKVRSKTPVEEVPVPPEPVIDSNPTAPPGPVMSSKPMVKELELFEFNLPSDWESIPLSVLRTDLLNTGATPEQVDAKLSSMVELVDTDDSICLFNSKMEEPVIDLPEEFNSWKPNSQYLYLTKERKLTPERANEVIWDSTGNKR